jgi:ubiquinone/menaquinone biosynthesis C-methylase UbiE
MFKYPFDIVESFWSKLADTLNNAQHYSPEIESFHKSEENFIVSFLKDKNSNILELGCGTGRLLKLLKSNGFNKLYGIDISENMIKICRKSLTNSITLLQHDFRTRLPFESDFFDTVLFVGNTLANVDRPDLTFKEVERILKKDGKLVIGCFNADYMTDEIVKNYYGKLPKPFKLKRFDKKNKTVYIGSLFAHWITEKDLRKLIESSGLKVDSIQKKGIGLIAVARKLS